MLQITTFFSLSALNLMVKYVNFRQDETRPGHILGPADLGNVIPLTIRSLNPSATAMTRFIVHATLYLGIHNNHAVNISSLYYCIYII